MTTDTSRIDTSPDALEKSATLLHKAFNEHGDESDWVACCQLRAVAEKMRAAECKCDLRTKLVGDGCEKCNPALAIECLKEQVAELETALALQSKDAQRWRPIQDAVAAANNDKDEGWIPRSIFAIKRKHGWEMWVGQCDDYTIWLGRDDNGACFETDKPTHFYPLPPIDAAMEAAHEQQ